MGHMTPKTTKRWSIIFWPILIAVAVLSAYLLWGLKAIYSDKEFEVLEKKFENTVTKKTSNS